MSVLSYLGTLWHEFRDALALEACTTVRTKQASKQARLFLIDLKSSLFAGTVDDAPTMDALSTPQTLKQG